MTNIIINKLKKFEKKFEKKMKRMNTDLEDLRLRTARLEAGHKNPDYKEANQNLYNAGGDFEKQIPCGEYCYALLEIGKNDSGVPFMRTKKCPFWANDTNEPQNAYCAVLGEDDDSCEGLSLIWDQVKECGYNIDEDEYNG